MPYIAYFHICIYVFFNKNILFYPSGTHIIISKTYNKIKTFACLYNIVYYYFLSAHIAMLDRELESGAKGRGFDSHCVHLRI